jgi:putative transcriptional regulator
VLVLYEGMDPVPDDDASEVRWGGPVDTGMGTVVTLGGVEEDEGWTFSCGIGVTRSQEALVRLLRDHAPILLCLGYAGWGPGQLDREIEAGGWLFADVDVDLVFKEPSENVYEKALATLGLTPGTVWMPPISE